MNEWHIVNSKKDLPRKSGDIIIVSDMGWKHIAYWDAHKRELSVYALRNHYDSTWDRRVLDGKVDSYPLTPWKEECGMCAAWCEIPAMPKEWEDGGTTVVEIS